MFEKGDYVMHYQPGEVTLTMVWSLENRAAPEKQRHRDAAHREWSSTHGSGKYPHGSNAARCPW
jgi:hypothetical protein